jgi:8-amino-7-oxononanoate synthase
MPFTELQNELNERAAQGLLSRRRTLDSPQSPHIVVNGTPYLSFCSNDYLGLANHPRSSPRCNRARRNGVSARVRRIW